MTLSMILLGIGLAIDLFNLALGILHMLRGYGPSPVPVLPFVLYLNAVGHAPHSFTASKWLDVAGLLVFHVVCAYVPLGKRRA
jgi:hypothetical protein